MIKWNLIFILMLMNHHQDTSIFSYAHDMEGLGNQNRSVVKKNLETEGNSKNQIDVEMENKAESPLPLPEHSSNNTKQLMKYSKTELQEPVSSSEEVFQSEENLFSIQPAISKTANSQPKEDVLLELPQEVKAESTERKQSEDETIHKKNSIPRNTSSSSSSSTSHQEETSYLQNSDEVPDSLKYGFSFLLVLSSVAVVFILFKVCNLRTSRAERKYGVQADRSTQELTPLPMAIDDGEAISEDECNLTLYEIHHQHGGLV